MAISLATLVLILQGLGLFRTGKVQMCYYNTWTKDDFRVSDIDPTLCTHIICAFAHLNYVDNTIVPAEENDIELYKNLTNLKTQNSELKILLSLGGFYYGPAGFVTVARDENKTMQFFDNAHAFLIQHNFDGMVVDWEFPKDDTRIHYQNFVQRIGQKFKQEAAAGRPRLLLGLAVSANHEIVSTSYGPSALVGFVDHFLLMTYDFWGYWISVLAHHSPLYMRPQDVGDPYLGRFAMSKSVNEWIRQGVPRSKLVLGLSTYARTGMMNSAEQHYLGDPYTQQLGSPGPFTRTYGILAYYEICQNLQDAAKNWTSVYVKDSEAVYAYSSTYPLDWASYDNPQSFLAKTLYALEEDLAGVAIWSMEYDDFSGQFCKDGRNPLISQVKSVFQAAASVTQATTTTGNWSTTRSPEESTVLNSSATTLLTTTAIGPDGRNGSNDNASTTTTAITVPDGGNSTVGNASTTTATTIIDGGNVTMGNTLTTAATTIIDGGNVTIGNASATTVTTIIDGGNVTMGNTSTTAVTTIVDGDNVTMGNTSTTAVTTIVDGDNVTMGNTSTTTVTTIVDGGNVTMGNTSTTAVTTIVDGDNVTIGNTSTTAATTIVDGGNVTIGNISTTAAITIIDGGNVTMGNTSTTAATTITDGGNVTMGNTSTTTTTTAPDETNAGCMDGPYCPEEFGHYSDCASCSKFYICDHYTAYHFDCPETLMYDPNSQVCDWPAIVDCAGRP